MVGDSYIGRKRIAAVCLPIMVVYRDGERFAHFDKFRLYSQMCGRNFPIHLSV